MQSLQIMSPGGAITSTVNLEELANILNDRMKNKRGANQRLGIMLGMLTKDKGNPIQANPAEKDRSQFSQKKYQFFLEAPFEISNKCCDVMKKSPAHSFARKTGRKQMTAQMASESRLRTQQWLRNGCNGFDMATPTSNPMTFWTEQDVLLYIKTNNLPICSVYGEIVVEEGQPSLAEDVDAKELFDLDRPLLKLTGYKRTGCMFCGYGCHLEKKGEGRFALMKETHPKQYDYIMRPKEKGGLNYKEIIDWINEHGNFHIEY